MYSISNISDISNTCNISNISNICNVSNISHTLFHNLLLLHAIVRYCALLCANVRYFGLYRQSLVPQKGPCGMHINFLDQGDIDAGAGNRTDIFLQTTQDMPQPPIG